MRSKSKVSFMVEVALFSAIATVLDLFSFSAWGQGGSISLQMIPIFIMCFRRGWKGGCSTGLIFGLIQMLTGYIINPIQGILDYPIAFALVGLSAITAQYVHQSLRQNKKIKAFIFIAIGCFIGSCARLIIHILSAVIFFSAFAPENQSVWLYAVTYNASYVIPSCVVSIIVILALVKINANIITVKNNGKISAIDQ